MLVECLVCGFCPSASLRSQSWSGMLGQGIIDTALASSKAWLQNQPKLGHQRWECLVQAQPSSSVSHQDTASFDPKEGLEGL